MAQPLLNAWGVKHDYQVEDLTAPQGRLSALYKAVAARQRLMKAAWMSDVGTSVPAWPQGCPCQKRKPRRRR
ncbi:hypothetical protein [Verrucomicrobium spinosum]|uniref:hypothetical protein n=1 Tax=Verrucomicrobium spinosum TaxID=2736 RepID=UPI000A8A8FBC|nr:hypothetical protein [Verrucomicrobium spinosum]